jgi:hypothetical protein
MSGGGGTLGEVYHSFGINKSSKPKADKIPSIIKALIANEF